MELSPQSYDGITKDIIVKLVLGYIYYGYFAADNMSAKRKNANTHLIQKVQQISKIGICGSLMYIGWLKKEFSIACQVFSKKAYKANKTVARRHLHHISLFLQL